MEYKERFHDGSLTLLGASRRANVPYYVLQYAIEQGHLPVQRRGRRVVVRPTDLDHYLAARH
jgi:hypothetical protein